MKNIYYLLSEITIYLHKTIIVSYKKSKIIEVFIPSSRMFGRSGVMGWEKGGGERVKTQTDLKKVSISFFVPTNTSLMKE